LSRTRRLPPRFLSSGRREIGMIEPARWPCGQAIVARRHGENRKNPRAVGVRYKVVENGWQEVPSLMRTRRQDRIRKRRAAATPYAGCMIALGLAAAPVPAQAIGEVYCTIRDSNLDLQLVARTDPRRGDALVAGSLSGSLDIHHQKQDRTRRAWSLDGRSPAQFWAVGTELNLRLFLAQDESIVDLIIETHGRPNMSGDFAGNYRFESTDGVRVSGRVECLRG
jgi:hypothetical protein